MGSCCSKKNSASESSSTENLSDTYLPDIDQSIDEVSRNHSLHRAPNGHQSSQLRANSSGEPPAGLESQHRPYLSHRNDFRSRPHLPTYSVEGPRVQRSNHQLPHQPQNGHQSEKLLPTPAIRKLAVVRQKPHQPQNGHQSEKLLPTPAIRKSAVVRQKHHQPQNSHEFKTLLPTPSARKVQVEQKLHQPNSHQTRKVHQHNFAQFPISALQKSAVVHRKSRKNQRGYLTDVSLSITASRESRSGARNKEPFHNQNGNISGSTSAARARRKAARKKESDLHSFPVANHNRGNHILTVGDNDKTNNNDNLNLIHEKIGIDPMVVNMVVKMLKSGNTVPFIARYRSAQTNGSNAEQLRLIKDAYEESKRSNQDFIISPDDTERKPKLFIAERARKLGLEVFAEAIIQYLPLNDLRRLVDLRREGLRTEEEVRESIISILVMLIVNSKCIIDMTQKLRKNTILQIQTKKTKNDEEEKRNKYEMYFDRVISERKIQPHQILAINRAESNGIISVKLILPDHFKTSLQEFALGLCPAALKSPFNHELLTEAFKQAFEDIIEPTILEKERSALSERAEKASIDIFAWNVKQLLLTPPVRGKVVLGVDPGFEHGCKMAAVSAQGEVLETSNIFPHLSSRESKQKATDSISRIVKKYKCEVIALGNGTGHRETQAFLLELIGAGLFIPVDVTCTIVNESGTSIYSCGAEAKAEFPNMDYTSISAVSIARRLQDPLAEYVKVDPKSLGVGMYQHDLSESKLMSTLDGVIMEVVSFVGVDVNTASQCLLRRISGLSDEKATNIIEYRKKNGPFLNRQNLKKVKGFDAKTFEQSAGFLRIMPETSIDEFKKTTSMKENRKGRTDECDLLDQTWVHPESYKIARKLIKACNVDLKNLGTQEFIFAVNDFGFQGFQILAKRFNTDEKTLKVIFDGLTMPKGEDIRIKNSTPLFRKSLRCINDLSVGDSLSGEVRNVVNFGIFVDIGVGVDGLIHTKNFKGELLKIGQRVIVKIKNLVKERNRIDLVLIEAY